MNLSTETGVVRWEEARRILCVRLDTMGDVLMTTPAIRALKQSGCGRQITLLTSKSGAEVARRIPEIDETIIYEAPWMKSTPDPGALRFAIAADLRARSFDGAVIFTLHTQSALPAALLSWMAGIPRVAARCRENPYHLLTNWLPEDETVAPIRHDVQRQLGLAAALGARTGDDRLSFNISAADQAGADEALCRAGIKGEPWLLLHPGATAESRRYPAPLFAAAARALFEREGRRVLVAGGPGESDLLQEVAGLAGPGAVPLPQLNLGVFAALVARAPVLVCNNSGPAHIAAAVQTPVVVLYALTNPQHAPWRVSHRLLYHDVPCKYCYRSVCPEGHHACLRLVKPDEITRAVRELEATETRAEPKSLEVLS